VRRSFREGETAISVILSRAKNLWSFR
jgi:hypothetical protein